MRTHFIKRATSALLALALVLSGTPLVGGTSAMAATPASNYALMYGLTDSSMTGSTDSTKWTVYKDADTTEEKQTHYYENGKIETSYFDKYDANGDERQNPLATTGTDGGTTVDNNHKVSYGNTNNTAYIFGYLHDGTSWWLRGGESGPGSTLHDEHSSYTFNFGAMKQAQNTEATKQEEEAWNKGTINTTYNSSSARNSWVTSYYFGSLITLRQQMDGATTYEKGTTDSEGPGAITATLLQQERKNGETITVEDNNGSTNKVQLKQSLYPSSDGEYLINEITVYNPGDTEVEFAIANSADVMVGADDGVPIIVSQLSNGTSGKTNKNMNLGMTLFDRKGYTVITVQTQNSDVGAGMTKENDADTSSVSLWAGRYNLTNSKYHYKWAFNSTTEDYGNKDITSISGVDDTAAAMSAYFKLGPHETKTARFAIQTRGTTIYVDENATKESGTGWLSDPVKSIDAAMEKIKNLQVEDTSKIYGTKKAYIYLLSDVTMNKTVEIPAGYDITIATSDYTLGKKSDGTTAYSTTGTFDNDNPPIPRDKVADKTKVIKRADGFNNPMFTINSTEDDSTGITFGEVTIDGQNSSTNTSAVVDAQGGYVKTTAQAKFINNKVVSGEKASVFDVSEKGKITLEGGTFENNTAADGATIIYNGESDTFNVEGSIKIATNSNASGKANVKLGAKKHFTVTGSLSGSNIGVSVADPPSTSGVGRNIINKAVADYDTNDVKNTWYSASHFTADLSSNRIQIGTSGNDSNSERGTNNLQIIAETKTINIQYLRYTGDDGSGNPTGTTMTGVSSYSAMLPAGTSLAGIEPKKNPLNKSGSTDVTIDSNYEFHKVVTEGTVTKDDNTGKISGTLTDNTTIKYYFRLRQVTYKFYVDGGNSLGDLAELTEQVDSSASSSTVTMPTPSRTNYNFVGWFEYTDGNNNGEFDYDDANGNKRYDDGETAKDGDSIDSNKTKVETLPAPTAIKTYTYVAKWEPAVDGNNVSITLKNNNSQLPLTFKAASEPVTFEKSYTYNFEDVPGYKYYFHSKTPDTEATGEFDSSYNLSIKSMPATDINVNYIYQLDSADTFTFTVEHKTEGGGEIETIKKGEYTAETSITATKLPDRSLTLKEIKITQGGTKNGLALPATTSEAGLASDSYYPVTINPATGVFTGRMPNQDLTVTFIYESTSDYFVRGRLYDLTDGELISRFTQGQKVNDKVDIAKEKAQIYGYKFNKAKSTDELTDKSAAGGTFTDDGAYSLAQMPASNVTLNYQMERDTTKWKTITFKVGNSGHGLIDGKTETTALFLASDGTDTGHTFARMTEKGIVPAENLLTGDPSPYYVFEGWYTDAACTTKVSDDATWSTDVTVYAKFVEDPNYWIDVTFAKADSNITSLEVSGDGKKTTTTAHLYKGIKWSDALSQIDSKDRVSTVTLEPDASIKHVASTKPVTTVKAEAIVNYLFDRWTDADGNVMTAGTELKDGGVYTAHAEPDPDVFGGEFVPVGKLDAGPSGDGDGQILVQATKSGKVYVVTTKDGTILASQTADATGNLTFDNLYPGTRYDVYELAAGTAVTGNISTYKATYKETYGSELVGKEVRIPVVESNYYFDYTDDDSDTVTMVIKPADADSQYAILDDGGNKIVGWTSVSGGQVTLKGLEPSREYTVVARDKTDTTVTEESKFKDGDQVISNPGDDFEAPKYVVETRGGGQIVSVAGNAVNAVRYEEAHNGEEVSITALATDASGNAFAYWQVMIDLAGAISGRVYTPDYTFTMKNSNVVLKAVYATKATSSVADITEEVRGASDTSFAVEPDSIADLQTSLTRNPEDTTLMSVNRASVKYNIVFNRRDAETAEKALVEPVSESGQYHPTAYTAAWALDVEAERYVNGRIVRGKATGSEAIGLRAEFDAYVQLDGTDIDQLDYELFDITDKTATPILVTPVEGDAEANAGLFKFTATVGHTYVMVYSKTFKLRFIDRMPLKNYALIRDNDTFTFSVIVKVRKGENLTNGYYSVPEVDYEKSYDRVIDYANGSEPGWVLTGPEIDPYTDYGFIDIYGYQYDWVNWTRSESSETVFALDTEVTRTRNIYGYYKNNEQKRNKAYTDLESLVRTAVALTSNAFLNSSDVARLNAQIAEARVELNKVYPTDPRAATYEELQKAIDDLQALIDELNKKIRDARNKYISSTGGASGGGSSSIGRGKGTKTSPYESSNVDAFELGVDGDWSQTSTGQWQFVLYGGLPLTNRWGKIQIEEEGTGRLITKWYYFNSQATMSTGWIYDKDSKWYYLSPSTANEGEMVTGWILYTPVGTTTPKWYYLNPSGDMATGWHHDAGNQVWYYLDPSGEMATGWRLIDGVWYYFNEVDDYANTKKQYGAMYASETTPDGYTVDADGRLR